MELTELKRGFLWYWHRAAMIVIGPMVFLFGAFFLFIAFPGYWKYLPLILALFLLCWMMRSLVCSFKSLFDNYEFTPTQLIRKNDLFPSRAFVHDWTDTDKVELEYKSGKGGGFFLSIVIDETYDSVKFQVNEYSNMQDVTELLMRYLNGGDTRKKLRDIMASQLFPHVFSQQQDGINDELTYDKLADIVFSPPSKLFCIFLSVVFLGMILGCFKAVPLMIEFITKELMNIG